MHKETETESMNAKSSGTFTGRELVALTGPQTLDISTQLVKLIPRIKHEGDICCGFHKFVRKLLGDGQYNALDLNGNLSISMKIASNSAAALYFL